MTEDEGAGARVDATQDVRRRRRRTCLGLAFAVSLLSFGLFLYSLMDPRSPFLAVEQRLVDAMFRIRGPLRQDAERPIAIAAIDQKSLDESRLGPWPWKRSVLARLVDRLSEAGARRVVFDVVFDRREATAADLLQSLARRGLITGDAAAKLAREEDGDAAFVAAVARSGRCTLGYLFDLTGEGGYRRPLEREPGSATGEYDILLDYGIADLPQEYLGRPRTPEAQGLVWNYREVAAAAAGSGYLNLVRAEDGVQRRSHLLVALRTRERKGEPGDVKYFPSLALATVVAVLGGRVEAQMTEAGDVNRLLLWDSVTNEVKRAIYPWVEGDLWINYSSSFPTHSICDILSGDVPASAFKDKIVLVGSTAVGLFDSCATPLSKDTPGVEVHATVMSNLLEGDHLDFGTALLPSQSLLILGTGLLLGLVLPRIHPLRGLLLALSLFGGICLAGYWLFVYRRVVVFIGAPLLNTVAVFSVVTAYLQRTEEKEKRWIDAVFKRYLSPSYIEVLRADPTKLCVGGETRPITAFFSDIQGFSTLSEKLTAAELFAFLSDYLGRMTRILQDGGGTLDKYEGDAIVAFFGAPLDLPDHALRACQASLAMQRELLATNREWQARPLPSFARVAAETGRWPEVKARIGLNTGLAAVGNLGSEDRFNYTMIGDSVNLAARLEGAGKLYGTYVTVSEFTFQAVRGRVVARELDRIRVVGKSEPVGIYELLAETQGELPDAVRTGLDVYGQGLEAYRRRQWSTALEAFRKVLGHMPDDKVSQVYVERCVTFLEQPPADDWDGVFTMTHK